MDGVQGWVTGGRDNNNKMNEGSDRVEEGGGSTGAYGKRLIRLEGGWNVWDGRLEDRYRVWGQDIPSMKPRCRQIWRVANAANNCIQHKTRPERVQCKFSRGISGLLNAARYQRWQLLGWCVTRLWEQLRAILLQGGAFSVPSRKIIKVQMMDLDEGSVDGAHRIQRIHYCKGT